MRRPLGGRLIELGRAGCGDDRAGGRAAAGVRGLGRPGRLPGGGAARDAGLPAQPLPGRAGAGRGGRSGSSPTTGPATAGRTGTRPAGGQLRAGRRRDRRRGRRGPVRGQRGLRRRPARARRRRRPAGPGHPAPLHRVGVAPYGAQGLDWYAGMDPENVKEFGWALAGEAELHRELTREAADMVARVSGPGQDARRRLELAEVDKAVLADPLVQQVTREAVPESVATGVLGLGRRRPRVRPAVGVRARRHHGCRWRSATGWRTCWCRPGKAAG